MELSEGYDFPSYENYFKILIHQNVNKGEIFVLLDNEKIIFIHIKDIYSIYSMIYNRFPSYV